MKWRGEISLPAPGVGSSCKVVTTTDSIMLVTTNVLVNQEVRRYIEVVFVMPVERRTTFCQSQRFRA